MTGSDGANAAIKNRKRWERYHRVVNRLMPNAQHEREFYFQVLEQHVRPGLTWLDAGCGHCLVPDWIPGAAELERRLLSRPRLLVGSDVDSVSLAQPSSIRRVAANLEHLPFAAASFDLISCNMVVEHLANPDRVFAEFFRVLKPGGCFIAHTPNFYHWATLVAAATPHRFHQWMMKRVHGSAEADVFPTLYRCNTSARIQQKLHAAGFDRVTVHLVPGKPRLAGFGPLLYLECLAHRVISRIPQLREVLTVVADKAAPAAAAETMGASAVIAVAQEVAL